ncbi:hypothetical protein [uncultured Schumannella sp.]|uniref:hypothetical protein n=1 Tax=uncultured Schumannella sp. TaxID=1195956 RepID=UPI0025E99AAD|nr:hypothetical protein [uncultured Schumannella sp.]
MSESMRRALQRRGALQALLVAAGVFAALLAQGLALGFIGSVSLVGVPGQTGDSLVYLWTGQLQGSVLGALPLSIGVFFSLWQLAPIVPELRLAHVLTRGALATAIGMLLIIAVVVVGQVAGALAGATFFGNSFPDLGGPFRAAWFSILQGVTGAFRSFVLDVPIVLLATVLLWGWQQRHPPKNELAGALDDV